MYSNQALSIRDRRLYDNKRDFLFFFVMVDIFYAMAKLQPRIDTNPETALLAMERI